MSGQEQDGTRTPNRSLKTLQHIASERENLVGRPKKSVKRLLQSTVEIEVKGKNVSSHEAQPAKKNKITIDDLTNPEGASENYWEIVAEKRQIALAQALEENEKLCKIVEDLTEQNGQLKQMLEEANTFAEVMKEELANCSNDTGIDINDVSAADVTNNVEDTSTDEDTSGEDANTTEEK